MTDTDTPFQQEASNAGWGADFTCPGCYEDLPNNDWENKTAPCPKCARVVTCKVEEEPVSVCRLADEE